MSLMNDALRKKRSEKKHPSGADFLKTDAEPKSKPNLKVYGLVIIGLLICTIGGYFGYEYYSLSRPMAPQQATPLVAATTPSSPQTEQSPPLQSDQEAELIEPVQTTAPTAQKPETAASAMQTKAQTPPRPKTESPEAAQAEPKEAKRQPPVPNATIEKASRPTSSGPEPVVEPDGTAPAPSPQKPSSPQKTLAKKEAAPAQKETVPIADRFYRKGLSYHRQNDLQKAIRMYLAARQKDPNHTATLFNLASAYIQVGAFAEAQAILADLHGNEPDNPEVLLNMAVVALGLDRPEQALELLDRADMKFDQPRYEVLFHQGTAHSRLNNFTEALGYYQKAETMAPTGSRLFLNIAIAYDNLARYDLAVEYYLAFINQHKNLDPAERGEIERRVRELKAYLAQKNGTASQ